MAKLSNILSIALPLMLVTSPALSAGCVDTEIFPKGKFRSDGILCLFSTMAYTFTDMVSGMVGKLYCGVQTGAEQAAKAAIALFVAIYGFQVTMGLAKINGEDAVKRIIKLSVVYMIVSSSTAWSAGMGIVYEFYMSFITESTTWVMKLFGPLVGEFKTDRGGGPGAAFELMDSLIISNFDIKEEGIEGALTELELKEAKKIFLFFLAMLVAMPSIFYLSVYWALSVFMVCMRTTVVFMTATVAIGLLLSLSPIFVSFMLFQTTYRFFDTWVRFMTSFALQVAFSFAVLAMYLYTLGMFKPFFAELSAMIFPYQEIVQPDGSRIKPTHTHGVCPMKIEKQETDSGGLRFAAQCADENFAPTPDSLVNPDDLVAPTGIIQQEQFLKYLFYNMVSLVIVSYAFASIQENLQSIATSIAGPQSVPALSGGGDALKDSFIKAKERMGKAGSGAGDFTSQFSNLISRR